MRRRVINEKNSLVVLAPSNSLPLRFSDFFENKRAALKLSVDDDVFHEIFKFYVVFTLCSSFLFGSLCESFFGKFSGLRFGLDDARIVLTKHADLSRVECLLRYQCRHASLRRSRSLG